MYKKNGIIKIILILVLMILMGIIDVWCEPLPIPKIGLDIETAENPQDVALSMQILFILTIISLAPSILIMLTSFTRIIIVLSFTRNALGTQQMPPNQVLIGLALFLTFFIMSPVITEINENAFTPFTNGEITQEAAIEKAAEPIRNFMFKYTREKDLALFLNLSQVKQPVAKIDIPTSALIPAFIISELKTAFEIGFFLYIPFLMIDMIVSSTLMSMGMMMLPPIMISMPFKILLFVMVDGWNLIVRSLILGFN
ncbi:MAG TPA: flagellar type III secretion system pore protein FliP [Bacillota bacterium]|nr:flagellar type III secretion system pore protein FliP [Clostridiaceae bacterium]HNR03970.1 flagellar type III secretion system pore protein FliP [Bacillota bacterium]HNT02289.1 flagellar type III secretion system pore protein FliP [Bacillota bacterium]HOH89440.1 flagellar type III secretion system pore protein FliP [Bacillota bacterium]HOM43252.1 flagellar type III secretion system pore protein FliP [Bacillota bacterium]